MLVFEETFYVGILYQTHVLSIQIWDPTQRHIYTSTIYDDPLPFKNNITLLFKIGTMTGAHDQQDIIGLVPHGQGITSS